MKLTKEQCELFDSYFAVADELDGGLTLDDLDYKFVAEAERAGRMLDLPFPPILWVAEEFQLDHWTQIVTERER